MPRRSRSRSPRRRDYNDVPRMSQNDKYSDRRRGESSREAHSGRSSRRDDWGYDERERERERRRDRERYTRDGEQSQRRSASPRSRRPNESPSGSQAEEPVDKAKPNFKPSGLLAAETNTVKGADGTSTVLKYNEPPEARKPSVGWRLYVFKGSEQTDLLHIQRQSAYLAGRDRLVADIPLEHPSCSKQHAAIQFRYIQEKNEFGEVKGSVKPFIIDLESTNNTFVNDEAIPAARYYELKAGDVIKFGLSTKEYVLLHDEVS